VHVLASLCDPRKASSLTTRTAPDSGASRGRLLSSEASSRAQTAMSTRSDSLPELPKVRVHARARVRPFVCMCACDGVGPQAKPPKAGYKTHNRHGLVPERAIWRSIEVRGRRRDGSDETEGVHANEGTAAQREGVAGGENNPLTEMKFLGSFSRVRLRCKHASCIFFTRLCILTRGLLARAVCPGRRGRGAIGKLRSRRPRASSRY